VACCCAVLLWRVVVACCGVLLWRVVVPCCCGVLLCRVVVACCCAVFCRLRLMAALYVGVYMTTRCSAYVGKNRSYNVKCI
jgi:hypothetical protein